MSAIAYRSLVKVERVTGPVRRAFLPAESAPVTFSVHGAVAEHYKIPPNVYEEHATTLDYIVAAAAGWLVGTFGGALEARQIRSGDGKLIADAEGEVEKEEGVLVIKRINVTLRLKAGPEHRETVDRVFGFFADRCPVYKTLKPAIDFNLSLELIQ